MVIKGDVADKQVAVQLEEAEAQPWLILPRQTMMIIESQSKIEGDVVDKHVVVQLDKVEAQPWHILARQTRMITEL